MNTTSFLPLAGRLFRFAIRSRFQANRRVQRALLAGWAFRMQLLLWTLGLPASLDAQFQCVVANGTMTITRYTGSGGEVTIPGTLDGLPVTTIGEGAFSETSVSSVTITNSVTTIAGAAFLNDQSLTNVTMSDSVRTIGNAAFYGCILLSGFEVPRHITNIGDYAFAGTALRNVTIPDSISSISSSVFAACRMLTNVTIPDSVATIGDSAFNGCTRLDNMMAGSSVRSIGNYAFGFCSNLNNVVIGKKVVSIGEGAFCTCPRLRGVYFQGSAPSTGSAVFTGAPASATVYYLPGTSGWSSSFAGQRTALWNPRIQTTGANFGVRNNRFGFNITGTANIPIVVEANTDPAIPGWLLLQTMSLTNGLVYFTDLQSTNYPSRFYRIRSP